MQALEKESQKRQQSMSEVITALRKVRWEELTSKPRKDDARREATMPVVEPSPRSRSLKVIGAISGGLLVVGALTIGARAVLNKSLLLSRGTETVAVPLATKPPEVTPSEENVEDDLPKK